MYEKNYIPLLVSNGLCTTKARRNTFSELQILTGKQRTYSRETSFDLTATNGIGANGEMPDNDRSMIMSSKVRGNAQETNNNSKLLKMRGSPGIDIFLKFGLLLSVVALYNPTE